MRRPEEVTILIADDEVALRRAIAFDFQRKGFQVLEASNGVEAFEFVQKNKVDIVLTDVRMPGGDGIALLDKVKAFDPELPVVMFITGFADLSVEDAHDKGADAVFSKPFDRKALMATVLRSLSAKEEIWNARTTERAPTDFKIALSFPELSLSTEGKVLNIGRGGIFVELSEKFPAVLSKVIFSIAFEQGSIKSIEGIGVVRWVRAQPVDALPAGCGIEFTHLDEQCRSAIIQYIAQSRMKAFIPKK